MPRVCIAQYIAYYSTTVAYVCPSVCYKPVFYTVGIAEFAGLEIAALPNDGQHRRVENKGLKNDRRSRKGGQCTTAK